DLTNATLGGKTRSKGGRSQNDAFILGSNPLGHFPLVRATAAALLKQQTPAQPPVRVISALPGANLTMPRATIPQPMSNLGRQGRKARTAAIKRQHDADRAAAEREADEARIAAELGSFDPYARPDMGKYIKAKQRRVAEQQEVVRERA